MPIRRLWKKSDMRGSKRKNTQRENRLEELGRVDAEKAYTSKGKKNLSEEKSRIRKELKWGSTPKWPKGYDPRKQIDPNNFPRRPETIDPQRRKDLRRKLNKDLRRKLNKDGAREITDPQRKKDLRRKLKPLPTPPSRKLSPTDKEHMRRLLKTGRPKIAKKGWK